MQQKFISNSCRWRGPARLRNTEKGRFHESSAPLDISRATLRICLIVLVLFVCGAKFVPISSAQPATDPMFHVFRGALCITEGEITETPNKRLSIEVPKMRADVNAWTAQVVEARFTYLGPTAQEARLASGELRRQFGLKLRAQNPCNLVYVMWRIEPESTLVVSVKMNPGQSTSAECGNHGYRNVKPRQASPVPVLSPGAPHTLRAAMYADELIVWVDGVVVWEGSLGRDAAGLRGPVGLRSDNARLEIELKAGWPRAEHPDYVIGCNIDHGGLD